jgi:hypothetical protein
LIDHGHAVEAGVILLSVIGIAYGGTFLLRVVRRHAPANELQKSFFRAGHAHAGVLVTLGLVVLLLTQLAGVRQPWSTLSSGVLVSAIFIPAGFFLSVIGTDPPRANGLIALIWIGAASLTVGLVAAGIGLITS